MEYKVAEILDHEKCARFNEYGMEGAQRKNPDRPVSLLSLSARQEVNAAELRGLCFKRFVADITIECEQMPEKGAIIKADNLALGILQEGKACWPECKLFQEDLPCPLRDGVRYAWVEEPGDLCLGEVFQVVDSPKP
ncbi:hypothetical protein JR338_11025 [Chloroflexota bacterium]|nr:hypothetical protein JR338_11025 [Chloroflexota bacterium]